MGCTPECESMDAHEIREINAAGCIGGCLGDALRSSRRVCLETRKAGWSSCALVGLQSPALASIMCRLRVDDYV